MIQTADVSFSQIVVRKKITYRGIPTKWNWNANFLNLNFLHNFFCFRSEFHINLSVYVVIEQKTTHTDIFILCCLWNDFGSSWCENVHRICLSFWINATQKKNRNGLMYPMNMLNLQAHTSMWKYFLFINLFIYLFSLIKLLSFRNS